MQLSALSRQNEELTGNLLEDVLLVFFGQLNRAKPTGLQVLSASEAILTQFWHFTLPDVIRALKTALTAPQRGDTKLYGGVDLPVVLGWMHAYDEMRMEWSRRRQAELRAERDREAREAMLAIDTSQQLPQSVRDHLKRLRAHVAQRNIRNHDEYKRIYNERASKWIIENHSAQKLAEQKEESSEPQQLAIAAKG